MTTGERVCPSDVGAAPTHPLEVVQEIVRRQRLFDAVLTLVSHPMHAGWHQRQPTAEERLSGLTDQVDAPPPAGVRVRGRDLLDYEMGDVEGLREEADHAVSISSRLELPGGPGQLAIMDINCDEFIPVNTLFHAVRELCGDHAFWLLASGRYFHVYADRLLDEEAWLRWNMRFQMPAALADAQYIARSMLWGGNLLRLTAGGLHPTAPVRVEREHDDGLGPLATSAVQLGQRRHRWQSRKNGEPMVRHLEQVARLAVAIRAECLTMGVLGAEDAATEDELYACGYLHDCIEDTNSDYDDIARSTNDRVARWVVELTEDKRLPARRRHTAYRQQLRHASHAARTVKLADLVSNLGGLNGEEDPTWAARYLEEVALQLPLIARGLSRTRAYQEAQSCLRKNRERLAVRVPLPTLPQWGRE